MTNAGEMEDAEGYRSKQSDKNLVKTHNLMPSNSSLLIVPIKFSELLIVV